MNCPVVSEGGALAGDLETHVAPKPFLDRRGWAEQLLLGLFAICLAGWHLERQGLGNSYYTAANISGAQSLRNLFFASFDRSGIMAVDKPPLGLLAPAVTVREFGLSPWTVLGPQVLIFAIGVVIVHSSLRRWFSIRAARIGALIMLFTPINIVVARSNNPDELLVLFAILAMVCAIEALSSDSSTWIYACAFAVSCGFLTKFLQAFVAVPVFVGLFVFSARGLRRITHSAAFLGIVAIGSLSWIEIVDHVAGNHRPYVANSINDREFDLAFGFSGARRLSKIGNRKSSGVVGSIRVFRNIFGGPYLQQASWLLPSALLGGLVLFGVLRGRRRTIVGAVLAWTVLHVLVFMFVPGKFSPYYLAPLVPGIAILVAVSVDISLSSGLRSAVTTHSSKLRRNLALVVGGSAATTGLFGVGRSHETTAKWSAAVLAVAVICWQVSGLVSGSSVWAFSAHWQRLTRTATACCLVIGMLLAPAQWTAAAVVHPQTRVAPASSLNGVGAPSREETTVSTNDQAIAAFVENHSGPRNTSFATSRVSVAAEVVTDTARTVVALGGFFGSGPLPTLPTLRHWITQRDVRWVAVPDLPPGRDPATLSAGVVAKPWGPFVRTHCRLVSPKTYHGVNTNTFWKLYNHLPIRTPLALYDCARSASL